MNVARKLAVLSVFCCGLLALSVSCFGDGTSKASPFKPWNGKWRGVFKVYSPDGKLNTRLNVTQTYTEGKDAVQRARFVEVDGSGKKTTANAKNWVEDGVLRCEVKKSDGSVSLHTGRRLEGGGLCWHYRGKDKLESFFERVVKQDGKTWYVINGFGIYGEGRKNTYYFEGRYEKIE